MELIRLFGRRVFLFFLLVCLCSGSYAQNAGKGPGISLGTELQNLEKNLARPGISPAERHEALIRLARLQQLAGDTEGAAKTWLEAAVISGDDTARTAGAFCLAAMGEWEQAGAALAPLFAADSGEPAAPRARYLNACLTAWASGDLSSLVLLAENAEYAALGPAIYYTLWKTLAAGPGVSAAVSAEYWKTRLLAEFPQSPEGRIAAANAAGGADADSKSGLIGARPSPLWLLLPGP
jgi:hypothetical protein